MKKSWWAIGSLFFAIAAAIGVLAIPNPLGEQVLAEAKYRGYIPYTTDDAVSLAYSRCTTCHNADKMLKYCARCGPPFIVTVHSMKKYVELLNQKGGQFKPFSDAEAVAITQAWNGLVGNWEPGWGLKNIHKLLQGDQALMRLAETPLENRPIEMALKSKSAPGAHKETFTPQ
ncbi:MAG: hypothetical protein A3F73_08000 [Gallionellales bacterium RIFCSPLOWO2_12_FULL_59_22]|nr:MAG: hypothetical protein A3H99_10600 [Gallionellales bacterium RIFCSPLOWO2_02_FULL_59_110]OGT04285.1 MAG: hypothetical protein A2Z65_06110 [Gallionellales bacterium RIFCSPLOWO2_02_58_13]OGT13271.1 MAG: hypothetical protein A3F73_08000 [Gallionellales bacterium RIFCSPLOWO2_12_FULL_59_22]